jgi:hypothetical protein
MTVRDLTLTCRTFGSRDFDYGAVSYDRGHILCALHLHGIGTMDRPIPIQASKADIAHYEPNAIQQVQCVSTKCSRYARKLINKFVNQNVCRLFLHRELIIRQT